MWIGTTTKSFTTWPSTKTLPIAARVLGSNQPNITHTMNKLENQLHCVLFIRSNRGVTLTPEGENLYARFSSAPCRSVMPRRS